MEPIALPGRTSGALELWRRGRRPQLDQLSALAVEATDEVRADLGTRAYVLVLVAEFQAFVGELIDDVAAALAGALPRQVPAVLRTAVREAMRAGGAPDLRQPDRRAVERELLRFDIRLCSLPPELDRPVRAGLERLNQVVRIRNLVTRDPAAVRVLGAGGKELGPGEVDGWADELDGLAIALDGVVTRHLRATLAIDPWGATHPGR